MIPKFRAWDKRFSEFVEDFFVSENGNIYKKSTDTGYGIAISRETSDKVILMQSTGLKDKNGKEIFEGDILDYNGRKALVRWHGSYASFIYRFADELQKRNSEWKPLYLAYMKCEIIGNIYENPEFWRIRNDTEIQSLG